MELMGIIYMGIYMVALKKVFWQVGGEGGSKDLLISNLVFFGLSNWASTFSFPFLSIEEDDLLA